MAISTILTLNNHPKKIISALNSTKDLPFREVLSPEMIAEYTQSIEYKNRYDFYSPDITFWALLSQAIDDNQTLKAAVARVIVFHLSPGGQDGLSPKSLNGWIRKRMTIFLMKLKSEKSLYVVKKMVFVQRSV